MVHMTPWLARGKLVSDIHNVRGRITNRKSNIERDIDKSGVRRNGVPLREKKAFRGTRVYDCRRRRHVRQALPEEGGNIELWACNNKHTPSQ